MCVFRACVVLLVGCLSVGGCRKSSPTEPSDSSSSATAPSGVFSLSLSTVTFAAQTVGTTSSEQTLTLTNKGSKTINLSGATATGDFVVANHCDPSLGPGLTCTVTVTFTPTAVGTRAGLLTIEHDDTTVTRIVPLNGTGGVGQLVVLSPAQVTFTSVDVGAIATQSITLTNNGASSIAVHGISTTGEFTQTNTCTATLAAAANCTITVQFAPVRTGASTGTVEVNDDGPGNPHTAWLSGSGLAPEPRVSLVQPVVSFGNQAVGTTSGPATAQFMNIGPVSLNITGIVATGDFAHTNSCPSILATNGICALTVTFTPTTTGVRSGTITITDDAPGGVQTIVLTGSGTDSSSGSGPAVAFSPAGLTFNAQGIGSASASKTVTVSNSGTSPLHISSVEVAGDFSIAHQCVGTLSPGGSCAIAVTFRPTVQGSRTGVLTLADETQGSPHTLVMTGTGAGTTGPAVTLSPPALTFGGQKIATVSGAQTVTVRNSGASALAISSITTEGEFASSHSCGGVLAAQASCTVDVTFSPTVLGTRSGTITIVDDAPGSPRAIALSGTGAVAQLLISPTHMAFSDQAIGFTTLGLTGVLITNSSAVTVGNLTVGIVGDFTQSNDCGDHLDASKTCTVTVTFAPQELGVRTGAVTISSDAPGSPHVVTLTGTGQAP